MLHTFHFYPKGRYTNTYLIQRVVSEYQPVAVVVQVGERNLVLSVAEHPKLSLSRRFQEAWHEQHVPATFSVAWRELAIKKSRVHADFNYTDRVDKDGDAIGRGAATRVSLQQMFVSFDPPRSIYLVRRYRNGEEAVRASFQNGFLPHRLALCIQLRRGMWLWIIGHATIGLVYIQAILATNQTSKNSGY